MLDHTPYVMVVTGKPADRAYSYQHIADGSQANQLLYINKCAQLYHDRFWKKTMTTTQCTSGIDYLLMTGVWLILGFFWCQ